MATTMPSMPASSLPAPAVTEAQKKTFDRINKTAQDFEAVFVTETLKPMFDMVKVDPEFGGGKGEEVFRDFTLNEYGKRIASQGGFGIATHVKAQLIRMQSIQEHPGATPEQMASDIKAMTEAEKASRNTSKINSLN